METNGQLCILVVDDEPDWRRTISSLLRKKGHLVKSAAKDREAGVQLDTWPFDLVLMNALLRGEITDDFWKFGWAVLMGDATGAGSEVIVITSLDKAMGQTFIKDLAARSRARKVFFKSELEPDDLLSEVHEISTRRSLFSESPSPYSTNCRLSRLAHVLAFHTTINDLGTIQKTLNQRYPRVAVDVQVSGSYEIGDRFRQVQRELQCLVDTLAAMGGDAVCSLCKAVLDIQAEDEDLKENLRTLCRCPRGLQDAWPSSEEVEYNLSAIRDLLRSAFGPKELMRFCRERHGLQPVLYSLGDDPGLDTIIDALLDYCKRHVLMSLLLTEVEQVREAQFERYRASLLT